MSEATKRTTVVCLCLLALAFAVRLVVWQNNKAAIDGVQYVVSEVYKQDARLLVNGDLRTFLTGPDPPSDATIIMHPPGYPLFIAAFYSVFGENGWFRMIQILVNSLAAVLVFFLTRRLFDERTGVAAGLLTAISPQFAYHSAILLPDELSTLPVLVALYFLVRGLEEKRLAMVVLSGVMIGLSCWLRANLLLLPVFILAAMAVVFPKGWRLKPAIAMFGAFIIVVAPMTVRNYAVFDAFVPVSIGSGTTFVEGLGEMDTDARTGMPTTDEGVMRMDAKLLGRPELYGRLYAPDGIMRERERVRTGLAVVTQHPAWFLAGVLKRGLMAFRMERVPVIEPNHDEQGTTSSWLYAINIPLKLLQRTFITAAVLPLVIFGTVLLLGSGGSRRKLCVLAIVPLYFLLVHPIVHTEYRYLLPATHVLMIMASVPIGWLLGRFFRSESNRLAAAK